MSETSEYELAAEQVFDYFLKELVSGQSPPDLSARIATAWSREQAGLAAASAHSTSSQRVLAQPVQIQLVLAQPVQAQPVQAQPVRARPVRSGQTTAAELVVATLRQPRHTTSLRRNVVAALLALCACGLLALLSWRLVEQDHHLAQRLLELVPLPAQQPPSNHRATQSQISPSEPPLLATNGQPSVATESESPNQADSPPTNETIDGQTQSFPLDSGLASGGPLPVVPAESTASPGDGPRLESQQIVAQIDNRLANLWQGLSITPSERLDHAERAQRISLVLTGRPAINSDSDLEQLISEATDSLPFAQKWADQFVALWLANSRLPKDDARLQAIKKHFASSIYNGRPWNTAPSELLGGTIASGSSGQDTVTSAFISALAGNGNHRMVTAIGSGFLDVNLSCVRCHDASSPASAIDQPAAARSSVQLAERQSVYWSLTAMLQGIDVRTGAEGTRVAVDRQAELLAAGKPLIAYYDLLDGRLQVAEPLLPDGQTWQSMSATAGVPRQALAEWLGQAPAADEATVNQVWEMVFGQPLVSHVPWQVASPAEEQVQTQQAQIQRGELQQLLAQQYLAHGHDLKQLVGWIVRSDALRRQTTQPNRAQWLAASAEQLQQWQLAQANFATGPRPISSTADSSLEKTLLAVLKWREQPESGTVETTLAQPAPSPQSSANPPRPSASEAKQTETTIHQLDFPPASDIALVEHLLASPRLSWENCVEHVAGLTPHRLRSSRIQSLADELLRHHHGDARATLLDLLWAIRH